MIENSVLVQLATPIAILILAVAVIGVGTRISNTLRQPFDRSRQDIEELRTFEVLKGTERFARLTRQTEANLALTQNASGRKILAEFYKSELEVSAFFNELEDIAARSDSYEMFLRFVDDRVEKNPPVTKEPGKWDKVKHAAKAIGGKLFDKANDLVKGYIGGGGEVK